LTVDLVGENGLALVEPRRQTGYAELRGN